MVAVDVQCPCGFGETRNAKANRNGARINGIATGRRGSGKREE
ncbi:hypothetical protein SRM_03022 [Salinibacter ruber M8]|uniref:Uncharacterized protein n=1 Tax=Salinibacter ruber (strain M8) TaxID=761659 RepID=D5HD38_SALRM|nr:hypothetical protein SRM_03022 [Salinibacter ruber M8]